MTKKEQAAFDAVKQELALERAMRYSGPVEPDVPAPSNFRLTGSATTGWNVVNWGLECRVEKGQSRYGKHCLGRDAWTPDAEQGWLQGGIDLYSTRLLALRAARHRIWLKAQTALAAIDEQIEREAK
jgi:hypothetical protein